MTHFSRSLLLSAVVAAFASSVNAAVLTSGSTILATPVLFLGGTQQSVSSNTFVGTDAAIPTPNVVFTGFETSQVFSGDLNNPFGGLTFVYQFSNDPTSSDPIDRVTLNNFASFNIDAGFLTPLGGFTPVQITRSANGNIIGFDFSGLSGNQDILPGQTSDQLVIRTDATDFAPNTMALEDGGNGTVASIGPAVGSPRTPEPASLSLLAVGGIALAARRRRAR